jgi:hypothetical protein
MVTAQKFNQIGRVVRSNARNLLVWRQRNAKEVESLCEELSGWYDKDTVMQMYEHATTEPYSWLTVRLDAKKREDAFWLRFESRLVPETSEDDKDGPRSLDRSAGQPLAKQRSEPSAVQQAGGNMPNSGTGGKAIKRDPRRAGVRSGARAIPKH